MDDVTFGRNGPYGETRRLHHAATTTSDVGIPGRSLMSMNALLEIGNRLNHSRLVISDSRLSRSRQRKGRPRAGQILEKL